MGTNPFRIEGPATIAFSGGRTSAYMLRQILDAGLQPDVHVLFANTGRERPETLDFIHECETRWDVPVWWLEYRPLTLAQDHHPSQFAVDVVSYDTASRNGEPFDALLTKLGFLPNPTMRSCTHYLKQKTMERYAQTVFGFDTWDSVIGIRADEPRRVARMQAQNAAGKDTTDFVLPLHEAGVTEADVLAFWQRQPFDLQLRPHEGNCDVCFLKSSRKVVNILRDRPDLGVWWADWEQRLGQPFRNDRQDYRSLMAQQDLFCGIDEDEIGECHCTD